MWSIIIAFVLMILCAAYVLACILAAAIEWERFLSDRKVRREAAARDPLDAEAFYAMFYRESGIPAEMVLRLRTIYCEYFDFDEARFHPTDIDQGALDDLDTSDLVHEIEQAFNVRISDEAAEKMNESFDSILEFLARETANRR